MQDIDKCTCKVCCLELF